MLIELWLQGTLKIDHEALLERHYRKIIGLGDKVIDIGAHDRRHANVFVELVSRAFRRAGDSASKSAVKFSGYIRFCGGAWLA
jgi:hypothetical protein